MTIEHAFAATVIHALHAVLVGIGALCVVLGAVQIVHTFLLGAAMNVTNANGTITRCSIMIGVGCAFLYGVFIRF